MKQNRPEPKEPARVVARCPRCGEPVERGRCTDVVRCSYTLPEARMLAHSRKEGGAV